MRTMDRSIESATVCSTSILSYGVVMFGTVLLFLVFELATADKDDHFKLNSCVSAFTPLTRHTVEKVSFRLATWLR